MSTSFESRAASDYPFHTVVVYGSEGGRYSDVIQAFQALNYKVINMWERCHDSEAAQAPVHSSDGRTITIINKAPQLDRICKNWLSSIVAENCARRRLRLPLIKIIVCLGSQDDTDPASRTILTPQQLLTRGDTRADHSITSKEMRRLYKLRSHPELQEIVDETIKFVCTHYHKTEAGSIEVVGLECIPAPWDAPEWRPLWDIRKTRQEKVPREHVEHPDQQSPDHEDQSPWYSLIQRLRIQYVMDKNSY